MDNMLKWNFCFILFPNGIIKWTNTSLYLKRNVENGELFQICLGNVICFPCSACEKLIPGSKCILSTRCICDDLTFSVGICQR